MRWVAPLLVVAITATSCVSVHRSGVGERKAIAADEKTQPIEVNVRSGSATPMLSFFETQVVGWAAFANFFFVMTFFIRPSTRTGKSTVGDDWADDLGRDLRAWCPGERVTGVQIVRSTLSLMFFAEESVRIRAVCHRKAPS